MPRKTSGSLVRRGQGVKDGGAQPACQREEDEGGARTSVREGRGRLGGPTEGHCVGWLVGRCGGEGRWAVAG
jgi:hypothetical protein